MVLRTAFHVHSDWSYDGHWSIKKLAQFFLARHYQAIVLTEHDRGFSEVRRQAHRQECQEASSDKLIILSGIEYSDPCNRIHILTLGDIPFYGENQQTLGLLQHVHAHGGASVFAHPSRKDAWRHYSSEWEPFLNGIELWNRKTDGWSPSGDAQLLVNQTRLEPFCGLDFHRRNQSFPLAMNIELGDQPPSESTLTKAIRARAISAEAFGRPVSVCLSKPSRLVLNGCERLRRSVAPILRRLKS